MTEYEKTKIRDMINGMLPEEQEVVAEEIDRIRREVVTDAEEKEQSV